MQRYARCICNVHFFCLDVCFLTWQMDETIEFADGETLKEAVFLCRSESEHQMFWSILRMKMKLSSSIFAAPNCEGWPLHLPPTSARARWCVAAGVDGGWGLVGTFLDGLLWGLIPTPFETRSKGMLFSIPTMMGARRSGPLWGAKRALSVFYFQSAERIRGIFVAGFVVLRIGLLTITIKNSDSPSLMERPEGRESGTVPLFFVTPTKDKKLPHYGA